MLPHLDSSLLLSTLEVSTAGWPADWVPALAQLEAAEGRRLRAPSMIFASGQRRHIMPWPACLTTHPCTWLQPMQQAKGEIAGLTDVTATNAEVMQQELLHHQVGWG